MQPGSYYRARRDDSDVAAAVAGAVAAMAPEEGTAAVTNFAQSGQPPAPETRQIMSNVAMSSLILPSTASRQPMASMAFQQPIPATACSPQLTEQPDPRFPADFTPLFPEQGRLQRQNPDPFVPRPAHLEAAAELVDLKPVPANNSTVDFTFNASNTFIRTPYNADGNSAEVEQWLRRAEAEVTALPPDVLSDPTFSALLSQLQELSSASAAAFGGGKPGADTIQRQLLALQQQHRRQQQQPQQQQNHRVLPAQQHCHQQHHQQQPHHHQQQPRHQQQEPHQQQQQPRQHHQHQLQIPPAMVMALLEQCSFGPDAPQPLPSAASPARLLLAPPAPSPLLERPGFESTQSRPSPLPSPPFLRPDASASGAAASGAAASGAAAPLAAPARVSQALVSSADSSGSAAVAAAGRVYRTRSLPGAAAADAADAAAAAAAAAAGPSAACESAQKRARLHESAVEAQCATSGACVAGALVPSVIGAAGTGVAGGGANGGALEWHARTSLGDNPAHHHQETSRERNAMYQEPRRDRDQEPWRHLNRGTDGSRQPSHQLSQQSPHGADSAGGLEWRPRTTAGRSAAAAADAVDASHQPSCGGLEWRPRTTAGRGAANAADAADVSHQPSHQPDNSRDGKSAGGLEWRPRTRTRCDAGAVERGAIKPRSMKERRRRDKISDGLRLLRQTLPPTLLGPRQDMASMIEAAIQHIGNLETRIQGAEVGAGADGVDGDADGGGGAMENPKEVSGEPDDNMDKTLGIENAELGGDSANDEDGYDDNAYGEDQCLHLNICGK